MVSQNKLLMSTGVKRLGKFLSASVFFRSTSTPQLEIIWQRKQTDPNQKFIVAKFAIKLVFFEDLQGQPQVTLMVNFIVGLYINIINEHNHK